MTMNPCLCRVLPSSPWAGFLLPSYIEELAVAYVATPSPPPSPIRRHSYVSAERFIDVEAEEGYDTQECCTSSDTDSYSL